MYSDGWQTTDSTRCSSLLNTGQCPEIVVVWLGRTVVEYHHYQSGNSEEGWVGSGLFGLIYVILYSMSNYVCTGTYT